MNISGIVEIVKCLSVGRSIVMSIAKKERAGILIFMAGMPKRTVPAPVSCSIVRVCHASSIGCRAKRAGFPAPMTHRNNADEKYRYGKQLYRKFIEMASKIYGPINILNH
jgi:hypothetical protein